MTIYIYIQLKMIMKTREYFKKITSTLYILSILISWIPLVCFFTSTMLSFFLLEYYDPYTDPVFIAMLIIDILTLIFFAILSILIFVYWKIYLNSIKQNYYDFNEYWYSFFLRWTKYNNLKIWLIFTFISFGIFCIYLVISVVYNFVNLNIETEIGLWSANLALWILLFCSFIPTLAVNFFNISWFKIKLMNIIIINKL